MKAPLNMTSFSIANNDLPTLGWAGFCLSIVLLAGCGALPEKPVRPAVYDFGPGLVVKPAPSENLPPLLLADIDAPAAVDGTAVLFRLAYADVQQLRPYAQARWSMPPAQLVRQRMRETLGQQRAVLPQADGVAPRAAALTLRVALEEFSQLFEAADRSTGLVRVRATLSQGGAGRDQLVAQRSFVVQRDSTSADAAGGVRALTAATDAVIADIDQWVRQVP